MMPIEYAQQRLVVAKLVMAIRRAWATHYYPKTGLTRSVDLQLVGTAVYIGQMEGRPPTPSAIARMIDLPRATVLRKLQVLVRAGYIEKTGRGYSWRAVAVNGQGQLAVLRGNIRRIQAAAKELSKLDGNPTTSGT